MSDDGKKVGYSRPPTATQFQPGNKRSPGRPKKKPRPSDEDLMNALLDEFVTAKIGGKTRKVSVRELAMRTFINKGISGNAQDAKRLVDQMPQPEPAAAIDRQEASQAADRLIEKLLDIQDKLADDILPRERTEIEILQRFPEAMHALHTHWEAEEAQGRRHARTRLLLQYAHVMGLPDGRSLAERIAMEGWPAEPGDT